MPPPTVNRAVRLHVRGSWPGPVVLRGGWARAHARPASDIGREASLRLERGSSGFLHRCAGWLFEEGVSAVISSPLHRGNRGVWETAGFQPYRQLLLMERDFSFSVQAPSVPVRTGTARDWHAAPGIDRSAFAPEWQIGRLGLADAAAATPRSRFLAVGPDGGTTGFAIAGVAHQIGYLQRMAVAPPARGRGAGRALLRESLRWAAGRGARTMLLNTQPDNEEAIGLYRSELFEPLPDRLEILISRSDPG